MAQDTPLSFGENGHRLEAVLCDGPRPGSTRREMHFEDPDFFAKLEQVGHMPLPPYLKRKDGPQDRSDYQTVYARVPGAVAAPTAGLHFDQPLLEKLAAMGVEVVFVTLHVGYGTFQSITAEDIKSHQMFEEAYEIPKATADAVNRAKQERRRILACGTTSVRALEAAAKNRVIHPGAGQTGLFVYPPYSFQIVDGLITNFHLPKSSLLLLAAAFLGDYSRLLAIYREAIHCRYRFYSYGDAMLIL
jgi:S-adenosylmethionine:tRNA ribosyltransferase-isomerase